MAGLTTGATPENMYIPPHAWVYQSQLAPVPKLPPAILRVEAEPLQIEEGFEKPAVAGKEELLIITEILLHVVVLHKPSALT